MSTDPKECLATRPLRWERKQAECMWGSPWVTDADTGRQKGNTTVPKYPAASSSQLSRQPQALGLGAAGPVWAQSPPVHHPGPRSHRVLQLGC